MAGMEESATDDPKTYKQAMKLPNAQEWKVACVANVSSLIENTSPHGGRQAKSQAGGDIKMGV